MKKIYDKALLITFCFILFFVPIVSIAPIMLTDKEMVKYSFYENRDMALPPVLTVEGVLDGSYFEAWGKCYTDQIWKRDYFIEKYAKFNINILKRPVVNNVVVQGDLLLPFNDYYNAVDLKEKSDKMVEKINGLNEEVSAYGGKLIYVGIPEQSSAFRDKYPENFENNEKKLEATEKLFFEGLAKNEINYINMNAEFTKDNIEEFYFKTDHHYNLKGAFFTYQKMIDKINADYGQEIPVISKEEIEFRNFGNPFFGSRNKKIYNVINSDEKLIYYTQEKSIPFTRYDNGNKVQSKVINMPSSESEPITYLTYMGWDYAETVIQTDRESLPNVLIFGDSFTNPIETFLYQSFNETRSIDLRSYKDMTITEYVKKYKPDYVFIVRDDLSYFIEDGNGRIE